MARDDECEELLERLHNNEYVEPEFPEPFRSIAIVLESLLSPLWWIGCAGICIVAFAFGNNNVLMLAVMVVTICPWFFIFFAIPGIEVLWSILFRNAREAVKTDVDPIPWSSYIFGIIWGSFWTICGTAPWVSCVWHLVREF